MFRLVKIANLFLFLFFLLTILRPQDGYRLIASSQLYLSQTILEMPSNKTLGIFVLPTLKTSMAVLNMNRYALPEHSFTLNHMTFSIV